MIEKLILFFIQSLYHIPVFITFKIHSLSVVDYCLQKIIIIFLNHLIDYNCHKTQDVNPGPLLPNVVFLYFVCREL